MSATGPLLHIKNVSKSFPGVQALDGVSMTLHQGEILAVVGENGAGKSTLMKILAGIHAPDAGDIQLAGQPLRVANVAEALHRGISLIHQELNLAENLTVAGNLFLGRELRWGGPLQLLQNKRMHNEAKALLSRVGLEVDPQTPIRALSPGQKQLVEIARALALKVRILIMDEPTSSLTQQETERLFQVIDELKTESVAIVYISHRLAEVERIADRVEVLRDGLNAGALTVRANATPPTDQSITHDNMVRLMVGRELSQFFRHEQKQPAETVRLELKELRFLGAPGVPDGLSQPISLTVRAREILGVAGLMGAGRTEMAEALFGLRPIVAGEFLMDGKPIRPKNPREAIGAGLLLVPEDRRYHGLVTQQSVLRNISLPNMDMLSRFYWVVRGKEHDLSKRMCDRLNVATPSLTQTVGLLSGGNQQKVVLGKWLAREPRVLILDEPTRGIDVGAKSEIYGLMDELARRGIAVMMISSDMEEILAMSDRVAVLHQGSLAGILQRDEMTDEAIMHLATGGGGQL